MLRQQLGGSKGLGEHLKGLLESLQAQHGGGGVSTSGPADPEVDKVIIHDIR